MSLQIYAYSRLVLQPGEPHDLNQDTPAGMLCALVNSDFPGRADDLIHRRLYSYERRVRVLDLSYGGYNDWREWLAKISEYPKAVRDGKGLRHDAGCWQQGCGPFWELINFADNEGCIGSIVCNKLQQDFAIYQLHADSDRSIEAHMWRHLYSTVRLGVELAANNNGCIEFS